MPEIAAPSTAPGVTVQAPETVREASLRRAFLATVSQRLTDAMGANGMSQIELAAKIGHKTSVQISLWAAGKRQIPSHEIASVARALSVPADYLLGTTSDMDCGLHETQRALLASAVTEHVRVFAEHIGEVLISSGGEIESALRSSRLLSRAEAVQTAVRRLQVSNEDVFDDLRGGAFLLRAVGELAEASATVDRELGAVAARRDLAGRRAKAALSTTG